MLHSFKKGFAKATASTRGINPGGEFLDYKNRLATLRKSLTYVNSKMEEALKNWNEQIIAQRAFSERFASSYPISDDDTHKVVNEFAIGSQNAYNHFLRDNNFEDESYRNMHEQVREYIQEIKNVEAMYTELFLAKSEAERYQGKVDAIDRKKRKDDLRRSRNLQKMDHEKTKLANLTKEVLISQKEAYAKAPIIYKAALCAYWSAHEKHQQVMSENMEKTTLFAEEAEKELGMLDVSQMLLRKVDQEAGLEDSEVSDEFRRGLSDHDISPRRTFPKIPSTLPGSPQINASATDGAENLQVDMEVDEEPQSAIAV